MNFSILKQRVLSMLQQTASEDYFSNADIESYINEGYNTINLLIGGKENLFDSSTVIGQSSYAFPTKLLKVNSVYFGDKELQFCNYEERPIGDGTPAYYSIIGDTLILSKTPTTVGNIKIRGTEEIDNLVNDSDTPYFSEYLHKHIITYAVTLGKMKGNDIGQFNNLLSVWNSRVTQEYKKIGNHKKKGKMRLVYG